MPKLENFFMKISYAMYRLSKNEKIEHNQNIFDMM